MMALVAQHGSRLLVVLREAAAACPKCGMSSPPSGACTRCGLLVSHMDTYRANRDAAVSPRLGAAWDHAISHWHDPAVHDRVVALAAELESFAWVATRYRELAQTGDAVAQAQLARISRAAEVAFTIGALARRASPVEKTPYRGLQMLLAVLVMVVIGTWIYGQYYPSTHDTAPTTVSATSISED